MMKLIAFISSYHAIWLRLLPLGSVRALAAENSWLRQQLSTLSRNHKRAPRLTCLLVSGGEDKSQYTRKDMEQNSDELTTLLSQGYLISSLGLVWQECIQFVLTDNLLLKRLKCLDYPEDAIRDSGKLDNKQEQFDANFSLLASELGALLVFLMESCRKKDAAAVTGVKSLIYSAPSRTTLTFIA